MKLLLDENLSPKLCGLLADTFEEVRHISDLQMTGASDLEIWSVPQREGLVLVSKDSDFIDIGMTMPDSPKMIWIRLGNCTTQAVHLLLRNSVERIELWAGTSDLVLQLP